MESICTKKWRGEHQKLEFLKLSKLQVLSKVYILLQHSQRECQKLKSYLQNLLFLTSKGLPKMKQFLRESIL